MKYLNYVIYLVFSSVILYVPINWITETLGIVENRSFIFVMPALFLTYAIDKWRTSKKESPDEENR